MHRVSVGSTHEPQAVQIELHELWLKPRLTGGHIGVKRLLCLVLTGKRSTDLIATHLEIPTCVVVQKDSV